LPLPAINTNAEKVSKESKALSIERNLIPGIKTRMIAVLAADGFNNEDLEIVKADLEKEGARAKIIAPMLGNISSSAGTQVPVDFSTLTAASVMFDAVFIPGGQASINTLIKKEEVINFVKEAYRHCKTIGALGEGINILAKAEVGSLIYSNGNTLSEDGIVTAKNREDFSAFSIQFISDAGMHRHWVRESKDIRLKLDP
jgi:catalase